MARNNGVTVVAYYGTNREEQSRGREEQTAARTAVGLPVLFIRNPYVTFSFCRVADFGARA